MKEDKSQMIRYAMYYGLMFGIYWVADFALAVSGMQFLVIISNWLLLGSPFLAYWFCTQYRKKALDNQMGVFHAWQFGMMLYFYASLIIAIPEFLYFRYVISPNDFLLRFLEVVQPAEKVEALKSLVQENTISAIQMTMESLFMIVFTGMILSVPVAFFARKTPKVETF